MNFWGEGSVLTFAYTKENFIALTNKLFELSNNDDANYDFGGGIAVNPLPASETAFTPAIGIYTHYIMVRVIWGGQQLGPMDDENYARFIQPFYDIADPISHPSLTFTAPLTPTQMMQAALVDFMHDGFRYETTSFMTNGLPTTEYQSVHYISGEAGL